MTPDNPYPGPSTEGYGLWVMRESTAHRFDIDGLHITTRTRFPGPEIRGPTSISPNRIAINNIPERAGCPWDLPDHLSQTSPLGYPSDSCPQVAVKW